MYKAIVNNLINILIGYYKGAQVTHPHTQVPEYYFMIILMAAMSYRFDYF